MHTLNASVKRIFTKQFNGRMNAITDDPIAYGRKKPYVYEIAGGSLGTQVLYGVTVLRGDDVNGYEHDHDKSKAFDSLEEAQAYVKGLGA